nr:endonuclease domain-containing protein [Actinomycetota bacterium]
LGLSNAQIRARIRSGHLHIVHPDVFAVGHPRIVAHARLVAALMTCGPASFLSHRTAAAVWGLREVNPRQIDVTRRSTNGLQRNGLTIHRTGQGDDTAIRNGLRVSTVPRLLLELASRERPAELDRLITEGIRKQVLDVTEMEDALHRHARSPGLGALTQALRAYRPTPKRASNLEVAFDALIADTDVPPPLRNVIVEGWELDCYWPHVRLAVELDGRPYHVAVRDLEKDRYKDGKLLLLGIRVLRITDRRLELEPAAVLRDVRALTTGVT